MVERIKRPNVTNKAINPQDFMDRLPLATRRTLREQAATYTGDHDRLPDGTFATAAQIADYLTEFLYQRLPANPVNLESPLTKAIVDWLCDDLELITAEERKWLLA